MKFHLPELGATRREKSVLITVKPKDLDVAEVFYDEGISGKVTVLKRDGFKELYLYRIENEIRTIVLL